jgi:hypothetical protein
MDRNVHGLPAGMVSIGDALQGFLTDLEERCNQAKVPGVTVPSTVPYGTEGGKIERVRAQKAPAMLSTSEGVND